MRWTEVKDGIRISHCGVLSRRVNNQVCLSKLLLGQQSRRRSGGGGKPVTPISFLANF